MNRFLLSSFSLMALIIMLTALLFIISLRRTKERADYKKWLFIYFVGLLIWHGMGFISGGLHSEDRELTYRLTNSLFNLGLGLTCFAYIQIAYLFPTSVFIKERRVATYIFGILAIVYFCIIIWFHFFRNQEGANSFTYASFVNPLAGKFSLVFTLWVFIVFVRKAAYYRIQKLRHRVSARLLAIITLLNILIAGLFVYPGSQVSWVIPIYIYGVWLMLQAQVLVFIIYSAFPVRFQSKMVGFTFASVMAILSITIMVIMPFTTNSDDWSNMTQRLADHHTLFKLTGIILGSSIFILWIFPLILQASIIVPLNKLMKGIQMAEQGDLNTKVPHGMLDEIGVVTRNFNNMVHSLKISKEKLIEYANTLELKVAERTEALSTSLQNLKATQGQLVHAEKMASLGELTAGIAHEIQNPLNFVNNFSEVSNELIDEMKSELDKGDIDEAKLIAADVKQNLEKINHHGKRAEAIVKGMLEHSRTSTGKKEPTDINALCDEYLRLSYHGLRAKDKSFNATMKTDFDESIGNINIVPQDIGRVILNLLTNAFYAVDERMKAMKNLAGQSFEPIVSISTKKLEAKVEIRVTDNGNGITQKVLDKIFQPFFTTKPTGQGTGLGLSLAFDIVTKGHGGELKVETTEGEGTAFIIQLPVV